MTKLFAYDVECLRNFFSITFIDITDYLKTFEDCCEVDKKGKKKPIPLVQKLSVAEIKEKLDKVKTYQFYITEDNDKDLLSLLAWLNQCTPHLENNKKVFTHIFGFNNSKYDKLMVACFLMYATVCKNTRELLDKLYETSQKIISLQDDRDAPKHDYYLHTLREYGLPYTDIDVMKIFALDKVGTIVGENGEKSYYGKSLKQTSINIQWYEILEYMIPPIGEKDYPLYQKIARYKDLTIEQLNLYINKWDRFILEDWIPDMMYYNKNDVFIVCEMIRLYIDEVRLRYSISKAYEVNVLSASRSNISDILFTKFYSEFSNLQPSQWNGKRTERTTMSFKRVIFDKIKFKTEKMKKFLEKVRKITVTGTGKDAFYKEIQIGDLTYTMATGGLHSKDLPQELNSKYTVITSLTGDELYKHIWDNISDNSYIYVHADVSDEASV